jgi:CO/xanthine dehydrogenase FAD-binding subunit
MSLPQFVHLRPVDLREASSMLLELPGESRVLAGGTDMLVKMKMRRQVPRFLVNLKKIAGLDGVQYEPGRGLTIGPLTTLEGLKSSVAVRKNYPLLHDAVSRMGTLEIRNCGTVGGNLCNASPAAETVPPLLLLGARLELVSRDAQRSVALEDFLQGPGSTLLQRGELLAANHVPDSAPGSFGAYEKHSLRRMDLAVVGAAALIAMDGPVCRWVKLALSAVGPTAMRAPGAEALLAGREMSEANIQAAARAAAAEIRPQADLHGTVEQKREMAAALAARVLTRALERAGVRAGRH